MIRIYGLKIFLSTKGYLNEFLLWLGVIDTPIRIMFTPSAVIIGLVYILLPFMVMPLYSSIEKLDRPLLEAAKDLGASKLQTFIRIIIPLTMPGIIAGCLLVMLPAMGVVLRFRPDGRRQEPADRQRDQKPVPQYPRLAVRRGNQHYLNPGDGPDAVDLLARGAPAE